MVAERIGLFGCKYAAVLRCQYREAPVAQTIPAAEVPADGTLKLVKRDKLVLVGGETEIKTTKGEKPKEKPKTAAKRKSRSAYNRTIPLMPGASHAVRPAKANQFRCVGFAGSKYGEQFIMTTGLRKGLDSTKADNKKSEVADQP